MPKSEQKLQKKKGSSAQLDKQADDAVTPIDALAQTPKAQLLTRLEELQPQGLSASAAAFVKLSHFSKELFNGLASASVPCGSQVKKSISKKKRAAKRSSDEVKEGEECPPSRSSKKSTKVKEASKTQASDVELSAAAAARRLSRWADDGERTKRWLASRGALEEPLLEANGQILRFRDYLPLEMADNVLAILQSLPEEAWQLSHHQNDKGAASHRFWSADVMDIPELSPLRSVFWKMLPKLRGEPTLPIFSCGRYGASDFIGRHDDQALVPFFDDSTVYSRTVAAIWYLTKEWSEAEGGCLIDLGDQVKEKQLVPIYNSLVVFEVPHWHAVSAVTSDRWRYSIFGWWHQKGDRGDRRPVTKASAKLPKRKRRRPKSS